MLTSTKGASMHDLSYSGSDLGLVPLKVGDRLWVDGEVAVVDMVNDCRARVRLVKGTVSVARWVPGEAVNPAERKRMATVNDRGGLAADAARLKQTETQPQPAAEAAPASAGQIVYLRPAIRAMAAYGASDEVIAKVLVRNGFNTKAALIKEHAAKGRKDPASAKANMTEETYKAMTGGIA